VLGSGFTAKPLVDYLFAQSSYQLSVTGLTIAEAEEVTEKRPRTEAVALNIKDNEALRQRIAAADFVVSMLPYEFHSQVGRYCVDLRKSMLTTSYAKEEILKLDAAARENGVLILKEIGLDPGFDHISAMQIIDSVKTKGGKIVSLQSYAGGFPAPDSNNNPWQYKFSWSPKGVLIAAKSDACYLKDEKIIKMPGKAIADHTWRIRINEFEYEAYPNRDALPYLKSYRIEDTKTIVRATLRYPGWAEMMGAVNALGLHDERPIEGISGLTYNGLLKRILDVDGAIDPKMYIREKLQLDRNSSTLKNLKWLGIFSSNKKINSRSKISPIDFLVELMLQKMRYAQGERDMVVLYHDFLAEYPDRQERITAQLVEYGDPNGYMAMSKTVGLPAAVATHLYLQGKIKLTGVQIPVVPEIYRPVIQELLKIGFAYQECIEVLESV
ncbi:MAG: saccharopine dehydrogenase C-terminal domain-containing protein, partial [bacterium]